MFFDLINISLHFWSLFPEVEERLLCGVRAHWDWGEAQKWHILVSLVTERARMPGGQVVQPGWSGFPENSLHSQGTWEETQEPRSGAKGRSEDLRTWQPWVMELVQNGKWYGKIPGIWALLWVPCPSFVGSPFHSVGPGWNWACWHRVLTALATSKDLLGNLYSDFPALPPDPEKSHSAVSSFPQVRLIKLETLSSGLNRMFLNEGATFPAFGGSDGQCYLKNLRTEWCVFVEPRR